MAISLNKFFTITAMILISLSACTLEISSHVNTERLQVVERGYDENFLLSEMTENRMTDIAAYHRQNGGDPLKIAVTYNPRQSANAAYDATARAQELSNAFRTRGVQNVSAGIVPVADQTQAGRVIINFTEAFAKAPDNCGRMPGYAGLDNSAWGKSQDEYAYGCTVEHLIAQQVANPRDLKGRTDMSSADGARAAAISERYRTGEPNPPLEGLDASEQ